MLDPYPEEEAYLWGYDRADDATSTTHPLKSVPLSELGVNTTGGGGQNGGGGGEKFPSAWEALQSLEQRPDMLDNDEASGPKMNAGNGGGDDIMAERRALSACETSGCERYWPAGQRKKL